MGSKRVRTYGIVALVLVVAGLGLWYSWFRAPDDAMGPPILSVSAHGTAHQTLAIGLADGPEAYLFGAIADVAVGLDGEMVVVDRQARSVRIFDRSGQFVRYVGREGDGPGEHRSPNRVAVAYDGVIGVCHQQGFTVFDQGGLVLRPSSAMPIRGGRGGWCRISPASSGGMILDQGPPQGEWWTYLVSASGTVTDSFPTPAAHLGINPDTVSSWFVYAPTMISEWRPDGSRIHAWTANPVIEVDRAPRDPERRGAVSEVHLRIERVPVHPEERSILMDAIQGAIDRGARYQEPDEIVERVKPEIVELTVGIDGLLWIRSSTPSRRVSEEERVYRGFDPGWGEDGAWYVVDVDEMSLRSFEMPFPIGLLEAAGDTLWASYTSDEGIPMLGRFEIRW